MQFSKDVNQIQQKEGRIPVHLQERVEKDSNELIDQKHIIKLDECSNRQFISPIVLAVKRTKQSNWLQIPRKKKVIYTKTNIRCQIEIYFWTK